MNAQVQTQAQGEKRVRSPFLKRMKRLLKGYIKNMPAYKAYRQWRHYVTGPLRMTRAAILLEDHQEQKAQQVKVEQERAAQFTPSQAPTPEHHIVQVQAIPLCGGAPIQVARNGDLARRYNEEVVRQEVEGIPTQPTDLRPWVMDIFTPIVPEVLPESVGVTQQDAEFLLDRAFPRQREVPPEHIVEEDPDMTTKREAIRKAG